MSEETEKVTRKERVDPLLKAAGWDIILYKNGMNLAQYNKYALEEYPTDNGPADYALCVGGKILAVIEAKKVTRSAQGVLTQAERYAQGLRNNPFNFEGLHVPFLYSTNGKTIFFHDIRHSLNLSREIAKFHRPEALVELMNRNVAADVYQLRQSPNNNPHLYPFQIEANTAIEEAIESKKRKMLIAMATGTGKTRLMVNEIYRLMKSGVGKRILFLVDRRALAAQAVKTFASFEPEPGLKFDKIYEVYSQRFFREDFDEDEPFDPKVLQPSYLQR